MKLSLATTLLVTLLATRPAQARIGDDKNNNQNKIIRQLSGAAPSSVIITELMYNPDACSDTVGEWIELFNNGSSDVDLGGWTIGDAGGGFMTFDSFVLSPGTYYIVGRSIDGCGGLNANQAFSFSLNNSGDTVTLTNNIGTAIDTVQYSNIASAGQTLRRQPGSNGQPTDTWEQGISGGSPRSGYTFVAPVANVKITEIMYNPSDCPDGIGEWIELYNAGSAVANLDGWTVTDNAADSVTLGNVNLAPQAYYILGRTINGCGGLNADATFPFSLNNSGGDTISIHDAGGVVVDSQTYEQTDATEGRSITREADGSGNPTANWIQGLTGGSPRAGYNGVSSSVTPAVPPPAASSTMTRTYQAYELELQCGASSGYAFRFTYELVGPDLGNEARPSSFTKDSEVPDNCQQTSRASYSHPNCGSAGRRTNEFCFDRGHLVQANHLDNDATDIFESNMMTNILPQAAGFNQQGGAWFHTEELIECSRDAPDVEKQVIFGGALFSDTSNDYFMNSHGVPTPETFWKVVIRYYTDGTPPEVVSWLLPNHYTATGDKIPAYVSSITAIQDLTSDSMPELPPTYMELTNPFTAASWDDVLSGCDRSRR